MPTYTTNFQFVNNGDTTVENPENIIGEDNINILNAEIQWEGSENSSGSTSYSTNTNTGSATAVESGDTIYETNSVSQTAQATEETVTYSDSTRRSNYNPDFSQSVTAFWGDASNITDTGELEYTREANIYVTNNQSSQLTLDISWDTTRDDGSGTYTIDSGSTIQIDVFTDTSAPYIDSPTSSSASIDTLLPDGNVEIELELKQSYTDTIVNNDTVSVSYPPVPTGYSFDRHTMDVNGTITTYDTNKVGETESVTSTNPDNPITIELSTRGSDTTSSIINDTETVSYPSVPSGYSFDRHYYREELNGSIQDSGYIYTNSVGDTRSVTSTDPNDTWGLEMQTRGYTTTTSTQFTQNPSVSGDVSASYTGSLGNDETSPWITLTEFSTGDNTFTHSIEDSGEGYYRIRIEWELSIPTAVKTVRIKESTETYTIALANTSDGALQYNSIRAYVSTDGVLAFDVVDPSASDASPIYIQHPTHGKLAFRQR